uniref:AAA+ ATPase domain-containing protein n=1 Tax=Electrophorus electricus TaxID=8005 RepID=A0A4W4F1D6_ELEEL
SIKGPIIRCIPNTRNLIVEKLRRDTFGQQDPSKPHKTILLVGEPGSGKSTLINAIVNYMLNAHCSERIWCEIMETKGNQTKSQTNAVTVYDVFIDQSPFSLIVIDTPGYRNTESTDNDLRIAAALHELCTSGVQDIDAVRLVVLSSTSRLMDRQQYVFDAVLSLFGKDVERNIILLITHTCNKPINSIKAIMESKARYAETEKGELVCFI